MIEDKINKSCMRRQNVFFKSIRRNNMRRWMPVCEAVKKTDEETHGEYVCKSCKLADKKYNFKTQYGIRMHLYRMHQVGYRI